MKKKRLVLRIDQRSDGDIREVVMVKNVLYWFIDNM